MYENVRECIRMFRKPCILTRFWNKNNKKKKTALSDITKGTDVSLMLLTTLPASFSRSFRTHWSQKLTHGDLAWGCKQRGNKLLSAECFGSQWFSGCTSEVDDKRRKSSVGLLRFPKACRKNRRALKVMLRWRREIIQPDETPRSSPGTLDVVFYFKLPLNY